MTASVVNASSNSKVLPAQVSSRKKLSSSTDQTSGDDSSKSFSRLLRDSSERTKPAESHSDRRPDSKDRKQTKVSEGDGVVPSSAPELQVAQQQSSPLTALLGLPTLPAQVSPDGGGQSSSDTHIPESSDVTISSSNLPAAKFGLTPSKPSAGRAADGSSQADQSMVNAQLAYFEPVSAQVPLNASSGPADTAVSNGRPELSEIATSGTTSKGSETSGLSTTALAFAMRLGNGETRLPSQTSDAASPASPAERIAPTAAVHSGLAVSADTVVHAASGSLLEQNSHEREQAQQQVLVDPSLARAPELTDAGHLNADKALSGATSNVDPGMETATSEPVRNVHMQLVGEDNRRVDVRLMDRGGELHLSVKSGDTSLTQSLQEHMPELTSRLEQQHVQAEVWMPKSIESTRSDPGSTRDFSSDKNSGSYSGNHEQRREGQQQRKPDWVEALENYS